MAQTIKLKRSAVSGNTPSTSDLELGEIAINTYDGKVFIKKDDGSASVIEVGAADNTKLPLAGGTITGTVVFNSAPTFNTAIAMGSTLNVASSIGIAGTTVIDSSRNLTNIGSITANAISGTSLSIDTLSMNGSSIGASGNLTLDAVGDIILDADGGDFTFKDNGATLGSIGQTAGLYIAGTAVGLRFHSGGTKIFPTNSSGSAVDGTVDLGGSGGRWKDILFSGDINHNSNLTLDVAGDITLDADGADIILKDAGTEFGRFSRVTSDFVIKSATSDKDIIFKGVDGGSTITALTLDMSEGGSATFANNVTISGNLEVTGTTTQTGSIITNSNFTGLSDANSANATDFGFYGKYVESSTTKYAGMYYDASVDNTFKLFCDTQTAPTTTVNESATGYTLANLNIAGLTTTGNVGIGIANTTAPLVVQAQSNAVGINLVGRTSDSIGELNFAASNGTNQSSIQSRTTDLRIKTLQSIPLTFHTVNTERMRLDASGNLFVGTTSQISSGKISVAGGASAVGITATTAATSGYAAASFQRTASDGQLIHFKKGSGDVGIIGTDGGDMYLGTGITGLIFNDANNAILPYRTNAEDDANIDIGLSSFRFRNLHLSGSANIGTNILMSNASTSGFMQVSSNILQFGTSSNDPLAIFTNNAEQIRIDTDGRLLLNTTSSIDNLSQLHIVGFTSGRAGITLQDGDSSTQKTFLTQSSGTTRFNTQNGTSYGSFQIGGWNGTTSADFVRVDSSGRVGIGTTAPGAKLHVYAGDLKIQSVSGTGGQYLSFDNTHTGGREYRLISTNDSHGSLGGGDFAILDNDVSGNDAAKTRLLINSSGNVGIGTTSPSAPLHIGGDGRIAIFGDTSFDDKYIEFREGGTTGFRMGLRTNFVDTSGDILLTCGDDKGFGIATDTTSAWSSVATSAVNFYISEGGNVGIGSTNPAAKLHVVGPAARPTDLASVDTASTAQFQADASNAHSLYIAENASGALIQVNDGATNSTTAKPLALQPFGGNVGIGTGTTAPTSTLEVAGTLRTDVIQTRHLSTNTFIDLDMDTGGTVGSNNMVFGAVSNMEFLVDTNNNGTDGAFIFKKDSTVPSSATEIMRLTEPGNLGIGTDSPDSKVTIYNAATGITGLVKLWTNTSNNTAADGGAIEWVGSGDKTAIGSKIAATRVAGGGKMDLRFYTGRNSDANHEKMRILTDGTVGIGTIAPSGAKLHVAGGVKATDLIAHDSTGINLQTDEGTKRLVVADSGVITFNQAYSFPTSDGSTGQALVTDGSGNITFGSVSAGAASSMVDADGDTKIQVEEASDDDVIRFDTAGSERMIITDDGKVGINNNSPSKTLSVGGTFQSTGEAFFSHFDNFSSSSRMRDNLRLNFGTARTFAIIGNSTNMHIRNSSADIMTFDTNNNVGIGTSSPQALLHVSHATAPNFRLSRTGTGQIYQMGIDSSGRFLIQEAASEGGTKYTRFVIDDTGEVGIGTGAPDRKLHLYGTGGTVAVKAEAGDTSQASLDLRNSNSWFRLIAASGTLSVYDQADTTERFRIDTSGNVGIGTTSPAGLLHVSSGTSGDAKVIIEADTDNNAEGDNPRLEFRQDASFVTASISLEGEPGDTAVGTLANTLLLDSKGAASNQGIQFATGGRAAAQSGGETASTTRMTILGNGNIGIGTAAPNQGLHLVAKNLYMQSSSVLMNQGASYFLNASNGAMKHAFHSGGYAFEGMNVGIGTTSPASALDVVGSMRLRTAAGYYIYNASNTFRAAFHDNGSLTRIFADGDGTNAYMTFNGGNVGIGNDSPNKKVHVAFSGDNGLNIDSTDNHSSLYVTSGQGYGQYIRFSDDSANYWINADTNGRLNFRPAGTSTASNWVVFDSNGSVGIGTSSLTNKFHVSGNARIEGNLMAGGASATNVPARPIHVKSAGDAAAIRIEDTTSSNLAYDIRSTFNTGLLFVDVTNGSTRMTIADDGNVGIGTTSPGAKLQVEDAGIDTTTTTTSATTQVAIDTFAAATFRSAEFTIQVKNSTGTNTYHLTKVLLIHDGTTPAITEYGTIFTGSAAEATFDADISSGNVRLLATPASTDSMTFKVVRHCITV